MRGIRSVLVAAPLGVHSLPAWAASSSPDAVPLPRMIGAPVRSLTPFSPGTSTLGTWPCPGAAYYLTPAKHHNTAVGPNSASALREPALLPRLPSRPSLCVHPLMGAPAGTLAPHNPARSHPRRGPMPVPPASRRRPGMTTPERTQRFGSFRVTHPLRRPPAHRQLKLQHCGSRQCFRGSRACPSDSPKNDGELKPCLEIVRSQFAFSQCRLSQPGQPMPWSQPTRTSANLRPNLGPSADPLRIKIKISALWAR